MRKTYLRMLARLMASAATVGYLGIMFGICAPGLVGWLDAKYTQDGMGIVGRSALTATPWIIIGLLALLFMRLIAWTADPKSELKAID